MLGIDTQYKLKEFFQTVAEAELQVERQRQLLATLVDFEPYAAFQRVNRNGDDVITPLEVYTFLRDNDVKYVALKECELLVKYFDLDSDRGLKYSEFMQVMLPCDDMYLRSAATQRPNYKISRYDRLPLTVERELTNLLERELAYHTRVERLKQELHLRYDWTNRAAFETVDTTRDHSLNSRNIQSFLRLNGFYATDSEIVAIIRRLDVDADQRITYDEFIEAVRPQSTGLGDSSSSLAEERKERSPLRDSHASRLHESSYLGASQLSTSSYKPSASPSRYGQTSELRASHASPSRRSDVTRDILSRSQNKEFSSPSRLGSSSLGASKRQSPLKQDDEEELVRAFKEQISLEKELEDAKIRLASQPDFNLMDAFQMLDRTVKGWVTASEIVDVLQDLGTYANRDNVYLFTRRYDKDSDGRVLYSDFCDAFTPKSSAHSITLNSRGAYYLHHSYPKHEYFTRDTRELFLRTFKVHFSVEESAELLRKRLGRRPYFSAHDAFTAVDTDRNGYLTRDEFKNILRDNGFYATDSEVSILIDRYDRNRDGRISYSEFIDEILPKSPSRR